MTTRHETYWNLHKQCFSYRPMGGRVAHADSLLMRDVDFAVQKAGRQRVIDEGRKNVHAFVRGTMVYAEGGFPAEYPYTAAMVIDQCLDQGISIRYNPYEGDCFIDAAGRKVDGADFVYLQNKKIFALGVRHG